MLQAARAQEGVARSDAASGGAQVRGAGRKQGALPGGHCWGGEEERPVPGSAGRGVLPHVAQQPQAVLGGSAGVGVLGERL